MKTFRMIASAKCPWCGLRADAATNVYGDERPDSHNSATMCLHCGGLCIFADDLGNLRKPTLEERQSLDRDARIDCLLTKWAQREQHWTVKPKKIS